MVQHQPLTARGISERFATLLGGYSDMGIRWDFSRIPHIKLQNFDPTFFNTFKGCVLFNEFEDFQYLILTSSYFNNISILLQFREVRGVFRK